MRIGQGFDVHKFIADRPLILGGVEIPFDRGLQGHSDADVLVHAVNDALLGAAALGDIGTYFPDTDPVYKDISSILLMEHVAKLLYKRDYRIVNIDATIIMQRPKVATFIHQMRHNIAESLNLNVDGVSVKATTTEHLGFPGREEGVAAQAIALIEKKE